MNDVSGLRLDPEMGRVCAEYGAALVLMHSRGDVIIGEITGAPEPGNRLSGTVGANVAALGLGARIFRVHDVLENRQALEVAWEVLRVTSQKS